MKIIKFSEDCPAEDLQYLANKLKESEPEEHFIFIRSDITYMDLSLNDLYKIKEEIEKAIRDKEIITLYDKGTLDDRL